MLVPPEKKKPIAKLYASAPWKKTHFQVVENPVYYKNTHLARCRATIYAWGDQRHHGDLQDETAGGPQARFVKIKTPRHHQPRRVTKCSLPEPSWAAMSENRDLLNRVPNSAAVNANARDHFSKETMNAMVAVVPSGGQDEIKKTNREGHQARPRPTSAGCEHAYRR